MGRAMTGEERRGGGSRRDVTRGGGRRETDLLERIRASFPDALECGPGCAHFTRHSTEDHAHCFIRDLIALWRAAVTNVTKG